MTYTELNKILNDDSVKFPSLDELTPDDILKLKGIKKKNKELGSIKSETTTTDLELWCLEQDAIGRNEKLKQLGL